MLPVLKNPPHAFAAGRGARQPRSLLSTSLYVSSPDVLIAAMSRNARLPTRRDTLRAGLSLTAALACPNAVRADDSNPIVVIGAGLAGLSAARDLVSGGEKVVVLEARERIGGRIWTSRLWPGLPMDLGASWIHGVEGNPLTALADEAGAPRLRTSYQSSTAYDSTGRVIDLGPASDRAERVIARARRAAEARDRDVSLAQAIQSTGHWSEADGDERRAIRHVVNSTVEQEYGGDWSEVSAWHYDDSKEFAGGDELFPQGFDAIVTHLAAGLDIRLGQVVSNIERTGAGVRISTAGGATIDGRRAIVTLPAGVLKSGAIKFAAPLDPRRQRAIEAIGMGLLNKCWLSSIASHGQLMSIGWSGLGRRTATGRNGSVSLIVQKCRCFSRFMPESRRGTWNATMIARWRTWRTPP